MPEQNAKYSPEDFTKKFLDNVIGNRLYDELCMNESNDPESKKVFTAAKIIGERHGISFLEMLTILLELTAFTNSEE